MNENEMFFTNIAKFEFISVFIVICVFASIYK